MKFGNACIQTLDNGVDFNKMGGIAGIVIVSIATAPLK
jgi:hypothetical protein